MHANLSTGAGFYPLTDAFPTLLFKHGPQSRVTLSADWPGPWTVQGGRLPARRGNSDFALLEAKAIVRRCVNDDPLGDASAGSSRLSEGGHVARYEGLDPASSWPFVAAMRPAVTMPGYHKGREPANKGKKYPAEILNAEEIAALFDQISPATLIGLRNRALVTVLYRAGLRHSEGLALFEKDVDLIAGTIAVLHGKGDRSRIVGIDPGACLVLGDWIERRNQLGFGLSAPLFCTMRGTPMKTSYLKALLPKLARQAGIGKRVHPHGLRHTPPMS